MKGNNCNQQEQVRTAYSTDVLFAILSNRIRRTTLFHLRQRGAATFDELVDVVYEVHNFESEAVDRQGLSDALYHVHLPKLEADGFVTFDPDRNVAECGDVSRELTEWLDLAVRHDIQYSRGRDAEKRTDSDERAAIRLLLVDDEPGLAESIAAHVERENEDIEVTVATSVLEAVTTLDTEPFDCIISDYAMPAISGLDFLKAVREEDPDVPFIVFTSKGSEATASQAISTGVTDYVQKRVDADLYDDLVERVRTAVDAK